MTAPDLVPRLARHLFGAQELQLIGRGQLADACRRAVHKGGMVGGLRYQVEGQRVEYSAGGVEGRVQLQVLAEWAASRMTGRTLEELDRRYAVYAQAATVPYTLHRSDPAYLADPEGMRAKADAAAAASRALAKAVRACLADPPPAADGGLFECPERQTRRLRGRRRATRQLQPAGGAR